MVKAAWDAVSVPAQSGDPTCTTGTGNTVTVTNPGAKTGTVGTATSLQIVATRLGLRPDPDLLGHRPADRPVDQRLAPA